MRTFKSALLFFLFSISLFPQAPDTVWTRVFGGNISQDWGFSFVETEDSGLVILGATQEGESLEDLWIFKTDKNGNQLWTKTYGSPEYYYEIGRCIKKTKDGNFIACGFNNHYDDFNWLLKFNSDGDTLWTRTCGIPGLSAGAWSISEAENNGFVILGITASFPENLGLSLTKVDSLGQILWVKTYEDAASFDSRPTFIVTKDNNYILLSVIKEPSDILLMKTDANGDTIWTKTYGGAGWDGSSSILETPDSGYIIVGYAGQPISQYYQDLWIFKVNSDGDLVWSKTYGTEFSESGSGVVQITENDYLIVGERQLPNSSWSDIWIMRINLTGDTLWTKTMGGEQTDISDAALKTLDIEYTILGWSNSFGFSNAWLIKLAQEPLFVEDNKEILLSNYFISQNFPNPFNPSTKILYEIPGKNFVTIKVYDVLGNEVATLVDAEKPAGEYEVEFNAANLPSGIYFYQLKAGGFVETKKMILLK